MKKSTPAFLEKVMQKLSPLGPITARAMFGGYGIYYEKLIFASIVEDELYFRVDDGTKPDYLTYGSKPFVYSGNGRPVTMPYMTLPDCIFSNEALLPSWIEKARLCSLRARKKANKP